MKSWMTNNLIKVEEEEERTGRLNKPLVPKESIISNAHFRCNQEDNGEEKASQREKQSRIRSNERTPSTLRERGSCHFCPQRF